MTRRYPDLGSASDWLNQISHAARPIKSTTHIWVVTRHHFKISALVSQTSFGGETSGSVAKCRLFSQATNLRNPKGGRFWSNDVSLDRDLVTHLQIDTRTCCLNLRMNWKATRLIRLQRRNIGLNLTRMEKWKTKNKLVSIM